MLHVAGSPRPQSLEDLLGKDLAARLDRMDILSSKMFAGKLPGERRSKRRGRSVEFDDFRDYIPGDDLRHVDWNVLARLDKLFIKLFREDEDLSVQVFVDGSRSMESGDPSKLLFACRVAMAVAYVGLVNQNRVSAVTYVPHATPSVRRLAATRGRAGIQRVARFLVEAVNARPDEQSRPSGGDDLNTALRAAATSRAGRGVMVVISDFLTPGGCSRGLDALAGSATGIAGFDTTCIQVVAPAERDPLLDRSGTLTGDVRLTDVESGKSVDLTLSASAVAKYKKRFEEHTSVLRSHCRARGIAFLRADSDTPVDRFVTDALRTGGLLR